MTTCTSLLKHLLHYNEISIMSLMEEFITKRYKMYYCLQIVVKCCTHFVKTCILKVGFSRFKDILKMNAIAVFLRIEHKLHKWYWCNSWKHCLKICEVNHETMISQEISLKIKTYNYTVHCHYYWSNENSRILQNVYIKVK